MDKCVSVYVCTTHKHRCGPGVCLLCVRGVFAYLGCVSSPIGVYMIYTHGMGRGGVPVRVRLWAEAVFFICIAIFVAALPMRRLLFLVTFYVCLFFSFMPMREKREHRKVKI